MSGIETLITPSPSVQQAVTSVHSATANSGDDSSSKAAAATAQPEESGESSSTYNTVQGANASTIRGVGVSVVV